MSCRLGLLLCVLTGVHTQVTPSRATSRQYHFINDPKNWTEAQSYCRATYTDLATIDWGDMERLNRSAGGSNLFASWIGLYADVNSWRWSLADSRYYGEGEAGFRNWDSSQPNNTGVGQFCVAMRSNGSWTNERCEDTRFSACYDAAANSSSPFVLIGQNLTWTEAQRLCRQNHTDLASVRNQTENRQIQAIAGGNGVWIGLFRDGWRWSDDSAASFRYWELGEPNNLYGDEHCAEVLHYRAGQWNDRTCAARRTFFCHQVSYPNNTVSTTTDQETTDQESTDQETTDQETTDQETTDQETTDQETGLTTAPPQEHVAVLRVKFSSETELTESDIRELVQQELCDELTRRGLPCNFKLSMKKVQRL